MILNYKEFKAYLDTLTYRPKLMLHSCCAPCSSHVLFLLKDYFEITIFYSNDNIYPYEEYERRLKEEIRFCKEIDSTLQVIFDPYNEDDFNTTISGMEHLGEKTKRCYACYKLRLEKTARKAKELGYEYFTTTLSISPYKNSEWINEIGRKLENIYQIKYLYSNFKKEEGYKHSIALSKAYDLYRQNYCGCKYSKEEQERRNEKGKEN